MTVATVATVASCGDDSVDAAPLLPARIAGEDLDDFMPGEGTEPTLSSVTTGDLGGGGGGDGGGRDLLGLGPEYAVARLTTPVPVLPLLPLLLLLFVFVANGL